MTDYGHVTPELLGRIREVIAESVRHTYSVSRVYGAYNEALRKNERPQTCGSCLKRRVRELKAWLADYERANPGTLREADDKTIATDRTGGEGYELEDGRRVTLTAEGKARGADGKGLVAGKYRTAEGGMLVVAPGSRARYVAPPMDGAGDPNELV